MNIHQIIGLILISLGIVLVIIGIIGVYKYKNFYQRVAVASVIDTAAFITIAIGIMVYIGFSLFSLKVGFIIFLMLLLNPLSNHVMVKGAYKSGVSPKKNNL